MASAPVQLRALASGRRIRAALPSGAPRGCAPASVSCRHLHRNHVLGEAHDAELRAAGHALEALAVVERKNVCRAVGRDGMARPGGQRHLDQRAAVALDEHVLQRAVRGRVLGIHGDVCRRRRCGTCPARWARTARRGSPPGAGSGRAAVACGASSRVSQASTAVTSTREQRHRQVQVDAAPRRRRAPPPSRCRAYSRPKASTTPSSSPTGSRIDRFCSAPEPDQLEHHALRELVGGGALEHPDHLVGEQDDEQHAGHDQPGGHDFAQNVTAENIPQLRSARLPAANPAGS